MQSVEPVDDASDALELRLLDTQARAHIRHQILHRESNGELVEDAVWSWSSHLDHLFGAWTKKQSEEFDKALAEQREIDPDLWR
jgi:hypothetical protein